jgi:hypothetical protein
VISTDCPGFTRTEDWSYFIKPDWVRSWMETSGSAAKAAGTKAVVSAATKANFMGAPKLPAQRLQP